MKILTAFCKYDYGIQERGYSAEHLVWVPAFQKAGYETIPFYFEENGFPDDRDELQNRLIAEVERTKPDYVFFILMTDEIWYSTLDRINQISKSVNWFCDDQWRFSDFSVKIAPHLSLCLTVDKFCAQKYRDAGLQNVQIVHWCPPFDIPQELVEITDFEFDVSFVGGRNQVREWIVDELEAANIHVHCFGHGWPNGKVTFERMKEIFQRSKINLNLSNSIPTEESFYQYLRQKALDDFDQSTPHAQGFLNRRKYRRDREAIASRSYNQTSPKNQEQIKARNFEIAGCGGFQVGKMAIGLEDFYEIGKEVVVYNTLDELKLIINYFLKNETERCLAAKKSFERTKKYGFMDQFQSIFGSAK